MLEKMARELALNAVERVKPDTYTNVVDEIWLYRAGNDKYRVSDYPGIYSETPVLSSTEAVEAMVAMMAAEAGAIVVVPEEVPGDPYLAQIAALLVDSADVPTGPQDVADGAAIVQTVKNALGFLATARDQVRRIHSDNEILSDAIESINAMLVKSPDIAIDKDSLRTVADVENGVGRTMRYLGEVRREAIELRKQVDMWKVDAKRDAENSASQLQAVMAERNQVTEQYLAAQQGIGALSARLEEAKRSIRRGADEAVNWQGRYEGLSEALAIVLEKAGVGK